MVDVVDAGDVLEIRSNEVLHISLVEAKMTSDTTREQTTDNETDRGRKKARYSDGFHAPIRTARQYNLWLDLRMELPTLITQNNSFDAKNLAGENNEYLEYIRSKNCFNRFAMTLEVRGTCGPDVPARERLHIFLSMPSSSARGHCEIVEAMIKEAMQNAIAEHVPILKPDARAAEIEALKDALEFAK